MLTYPRFAKACYVFFAVAVLAAVLKLSISGAETGLLRMLPAVPTASAVEPAATSAIGPEDPRLGGFMQAGEAESFEAALTRPAPREDEPEGAAGDPAAPSGDGPSDDASAVFRRPSLERDPASEPVCGDLGDVPRSSRVVFPLPEEYFDSYDDTWGAARPQGGHEGSDLMSPAGTPEFAVTDGRLVAVAGSNENGWNRLGGYAVMLEAAYDVGPIKKGDLFYYAHLDRESSLPVGTEVRAGQKIGTVGDTGEGPEVTRGKFPPHLHLGWYDAELSEDRSEAESGAMNPYPMLLWLERNGGAVSGGTDAAYCQAPQSPNPTPSTGEPDWPTPSSPGQRPDLDTGSDAASPAPRGGGDRNERPRDGGRDRDAGEDRGEGKGEGGEAEEAEQAQKEAEKLSLRRELEEKMAALLRDLPDLNFDRDTPENGSEGKRDGGEKGDGRKDGEQGGKERGEGRRDGERPAEDRPEGDRVVPSEEPPKASVPREPRPDRRPQPAPAAKDEPPKVAEEPAPPKAERESPAAAPEPPISAAPSEPAGGDPTATDLTAPVRGEAPPAEEEEAEPAVEPEETD